jgi:hypothetical protein
MWFSLNINKERRGKDTHGKEREKKRGNWIGKEHKRGGIKPNSQVIFTNTLISQ